MGDRHEAEREEDEQAQESVDDRRRRLGNLGGPNHELTPGSILLLSGLDRSQRTDALRDIALLSTPRAGEIRRSVIHHVLFATTIAVGRDLVAYDFTAGGAGLDIVVNGLFAVRARSALPRGVFPLGTLPGWTSAVRALIEFRGHVAPTLGALENDRFISAVRAFPGGGGQLPLALGACD